MSGNICPVRSTLPLLLKRDGVLGGSQLFLDVVNSSSTGPSPFYNSTNGYDRVRRQPDRPGDHAGPAASGRPPRCRRGRRRVDQDRSRAPAGSRRSDRPPSSTPIEIRTRLSVMPAPACARRALTDESSPPGGSPASRLPPRLTARSQAIFSASRNANAFSRRPSRPGRKWVPRRCSGDRYRPALHFRVLSRKPR